MGLEWQSIVATLGVLLGPLITWMVGRQDRNDKRVALVRDIEILKSINSESAEYGQLETQVRGSLAKFLEERERKDATAPVYRRYYGFLTFSAIYLALTWVGAQNWVGGDWSGWITAGRFAALLIGVSFVASILWIILKLVFAVGHAAVLWIRMRHTAWELKRTQSERDREMEECETAARLLANAERQDSNAPNLEGRHGF
ncbi:hypothetical protein [Dietzia sp. UCD-THP]|uniref:hypothetical protein n=1 Tax=Dietzia sp. UCD-THP TaxID=1292020 RepID=UPI001269589A|nr:hypothetical protein [Dietzia sp. UCD-THP]